MADIAGYRRGNKRETTASEEVEESHVNYCFIS
jgi:hypothetical protein